MSRLTDILRGQSRKSRFPVSIFLIYFFVLLFMSGLHVGLVVMMNELRWPQFIQVIAPMLYWFVVAAGLTIFTRWKIWKTYDTPMKRLAEATDKVAHGDFSIFVPTIHTIEKQDYLDAMIHDFNKMVEELGSIETLKTDFFSNVSHEIKTPLSAIHNYTQLLQKEDLTNQERMLYTDNILQATRRLSNLITNMLKLNKLERQTIQAVPQQYDLCQQLCDCAFQFEDQWEKKGIEFSANIQDRVMIEADSELMELVWNNLLSNATKFTPRGGSIRLIQTSGDDAITVTVVDTGCGMEEETMNRIFDKFYQGDSSHATEGNGLGLSLVQRILQLSEGSISVSSNPGKGSSFTVKIPVSGVWCLVPGQCRNRTGLTRK